jgi:rubrerythrin
LKRILSAIVERIRGLFGSSDADSKSKSSSNPPDDGPDLYECEGCGAVFISKPEQCSTCEDDDFSYVGTF